MNYIIRQVGDQQLHCVLSFDGQLDTDALQRAVQLTLDMEPVLGCRYVEHPRRARWVLRADLDDKAFYQVIRSSDVAQDLWLFITTPADPSADPLVQVRLFRNQTDTLCIKTSHVVADATACKQYLYRLAATYRRLQQDTAYSPRRNPRSRRESGRGEGQLFIRFGPLTLARAYRRRFSPTPTWGFPRQTMDFSGLNYAIMRLPPARFNLLREYGRQRRATLNDVALTAFYRVLFAIVDPPAGPPLPVSVPVDLRRYLAADHPLPVCNFSSSIFPALTRAPGERFDETLTRTRDVMNALKADHPGLHSAIYQTWSFVRGYESAKQNIQTMQSLGMQYGTFYPMLTNFGVLDHEQLGFGPSAPNDAYMVSPLFFPPGFMVGVNTFRDILTITAGFSHTATDKQIVQRFMELLDQELPGEGLLTPGIRYGLT